jgi:polar amino acid transport system substrate-binding protein
MHRFCHQLPGGPAASGARANAAARSLVALGLATALIWAGPAAGSEKLRVAMVNWPPAKIIENGRFGGTDVLMLEELADQIGIVLEYVECPWRRCLVMAEAGEVDVISSLTKSPERERYLQFIEPPYRNGYDIYFYTRETDLKKYEDLQGLSIGHIRGSAYFDRFDGDRRLTKFAVTREDQLLEMLSRGRLDVVVGIGRNLDYLIQRRNLSTVIRRTSLVVPTVAPTYIAISRKSSGLHLAPRIGQALLKMTRAHRMQTIEHDFMAEPAEAGQDPHAPSAD